MFVGSLFGIDDTQTKDNFFAFLWDDLDLQSDVFFEKGVIQQILNFGPVLFSRFYAILYDVFHLRVLDFVKARRFYSLWKLSYNEINFFSKRDDNDKR